MISAINGPNAYKPTITNDFDQRQCQFYDDVVGQYGQGAVTGLCLGVSIAWLQYRYGLAPNSKDDFAARVNPDYSQSIRIWALRAFQAQDWSAECDQIVTPMGFHREHAGQAYQFAPGNIPQRLGRLDTAQDVMLKDPTKRYNILGFYTPNYSHATAYINMESGAVAFFDPNHGYGFFPVRNKFVYWFRNMLVPEYHLGAVNYFQMHYSRP